MDFDAWRLQTSVDGRADDSISRTRRCSAVHTNSWSPVWRQSNTERWHASFPQGARGSIDRAGQSRNEVVRRDRTRGLEAGWTRPGAVSAGLRRRRVGIIRFLVRSVAAGRQTNWQALGRLESCTSAIWRLMARQIIHNSCIVCDHHDTGSRVRTFPSRDVFPSAFPPSYLYLDVNKRATATKVPYSRHYILAVSGRIPSIIRCDIFLENLFTW